jgi:host factor-I protein
LRQPSHLPATNHVHRRGIPCYAALRDTGFGRRLGGPGSVGGPARRLALSRNNKRISAVATEKSQNVQDVFLNHVRKSKTPVTVFLVNGVKLQGIITWFDNFSMLLRRDGHTQLVYKHAISTVMPGAPIQLFEGPKDTVAERPASPSTLTIPQRESVPADA